MTAKRTLQLVLAFVLMFTTLAFTTEAQAWSACGSTYVVQRGDWMAKIARKCGVSLSDLIAANSWTAYYRYIYPGQVLTIPGGYEDPGTVYCGPGYDAYGSYYIVCRGDTLAGIARYYGVSTWHLGERNGIYNLNLIYAGQVIRP